MTMVEGRIRASQGQRVQLQPTYFFGPGVTVPALLLERARRQKCVVVCCDGRSGSLELDPAARSSLDASILEAC